MKNNQLVPVFLILGYSLFFLLKISPLNWLFFVTGLIIGFFLYLVDYLLYPFYADQNLELVIVAKKYLQQKNYQHYLQLLWLNQKAMAHLLSRSFLFIIIYFPLTIFVLSSSSQVFGQGVVLGIGLNLAIKLWQLRNDPEQFHQHFFWQAETQISPLVINRVVIGFSLLFGLLTVLALF